MKPKDLALLKALLQEGVRPKFIIEKIPSLRGRNSFISKLRKKMGMVPFRRSRVVGWHSNGVSKSMKLSVKLRSEGWTLAKIGKKIGVSRERVRQYLLNPD